MNGQTILEAIGYFATGLVLISFLMTSVIKLRLINLIGSAIFTVYAVLIHSYPTAVMNLGICAINVYFLTRLLRAEKHTTLELARPDDAYIRSFLAHYREDIQKFFPDFSPQTETDEAYFVCDDLTPRGLLLGKKQDDGSLLIQLDYATPTYRDHSVGNFLYPKLLDHYTALEYNKVSRKHKSYLEKMGFRKRGGKYRLENPKV